ncbi:transposase [Telmatocola sphagniphila]|jgi:SRSO17 transposase|uniref:Transposase n=1 Tax=Telmatocola sphagniphila TaxID=1123043 RepID=A0A8E6B894_9BACT|nr:transposase [Telmatocola sphagniphila]QVL33702.1 transposase [Telmatocola sphagniphila]
MSLLDLTEDRRERLEEYISGYKTVFQRSDQFQRFRAYILGLLSKAERKNIESIATASLPYVSAQPDFGQALQHFIAQSPWNHDLLLKRYRQFLAELLPWEKTDWVVHDIVYPKKGRHSVGVQRQLARSLGRKSNCQVAVAITATSERFAVPLAVRLYLPNQWLRANLEQKFDSSIPLSARQYSPKATIALNMLDDLQFKDITFGRMYAEEGYSLTGQFSDGLQSRQFHNCANLQESPEDGRCVFRLYEWLRNNLGLGHFEGRNWLGWHHHTSLVFVAFGFLLRESLDSDFRFEG